MTEQQQVKTRKQNSWIIHLKAYSKQNNIPYAAAISDPKCRELYLNSKNPKSAEPVPAEFTETVPESKPAPVVEEPLVEKPKKKRKKRKKVESEE